MKPEEFKALLATEPFRRFTVHLTDAKAIEITHPDQVLVSRDSAVIGLNPNEHGLIDGFSICYLPHVVKIERQLAR